MVSDEPKKPILQPLQFAFRSLANFTSTLITGYEKLSTPIVMVTASSNDLVIQGLYVEFLSADCKHAQRPKKWIDKTHLESLCILGAIVPLY